MQTIPAIRILAPTATPPVIPLDPSYSSARSGVDVRGVGLLLSYTLAPETHVMVCAGDPIGGARASWLGWAVTETPVPVDQVKEIARVMGARLLDQMSALELATGAAEELRRMHGIAVAKGEAEPGLRDRHMGIAVGLASTLQILEVVLDRLGPGLAELSGQPARDRAAARPPISFAEGLAETVQAIQDGLGDRAEVMVLVAEPGGAD